MSTKEVCEPNFQALQDTLDVIGSKWRVQILASDSMLEWGEKYGANSKQQKKEDE